MKSIPIARRTLPLGLSLLLLGLPSARALDANGNGLNDIWELVYGASGLLQNEDTDGDGVSNRVESNAGTNPFDAGSRPTLQALPWSPAQLQLAYPRFAGKRYRLESKTDLAQPTWTPENVEVSPDGTVANYLLPKTGPQKFWRLVIDDLDTDGDGYLDAEERWLGFDPNTTRSERSDQTDQTRIAAGLSAASVVTIAVLDSRMTERWPDPGLVVVRRSGGLKPILVHASFSGTAIRNMDFTANPSGTLVYFPPGVREVPIELHPIADANDGEGAESIIITLQPGPGYSLGTGISATVMLENETAASLPSAKAAARFLLQAAFGPDEDLSDADDIPENVEEVMAMGYNAWIDDQFTRPIGYLQPYVDWAVVNAEPIQLYGNAKEHSWWARALGAPKLRPDAVTTVQPDPLRQRIAFALSQILVVSDRPEALAVEQRGMANYYDLMEQHAFGNYRDLLRAVALHPVMGVYLSHVGNRKADPVNKIYPDENFAREIMQLFSIGLWKLNANGTRELDNQDQPIPTYNNGDITELARVFTGLSYGNNANFQSDPKDFTVPMKGWDAFHDLGPKTLLGGLQLPARAESAGSTGTATMADVNAAVDNLFNHQNVGPFLAQRLIQRLVTSNPSSAYIGRVAAAFAGNGSGVRGDMKAVIKAILLDPEARDPAMMSQPTWGRLREPFLRCVNFARAFNAASVAGYYPLDQFALDHAQDPLNSPSVFNFYLPTHSPPGPITQLGLVAPEFQIVNASTAVTGANYFWEHTISDLHHYGNGNANYAVNLNLPWELTYVVPAAQVNQTTPAGPVQDTDAMLRRLDLALTGGTLSARQFQIIREAMLRIPTSSERWHRERFRMAVYLITTSADFNVFR